MDLVEVISLCDGSPEQLANISQSIEQIPCDQDGNKLLQSLLVPILSKGYLGLVDQLISKGVDLSVSDEDGRTALHFAAKGGHIDVVALLLERGAYLEPADRYVRVLLHSAAVKGRKKVVSLLLERGASIEAVNDGGRTALHLAAKGGHTNVVALLLERGANLETADWSGNTPLHYAVKVGNMDVVVLLLERRANLAAKDENGLTPLHWAAKVGSMEAVSLLLERGANMEAVEKDGKSSLHLAADRGRKEVVLLLLEKGANLETADRDGRTALHFAAKGGHIDVVALLLERGAYLEPADRGGKTALHVAAQEVHKKLVSLLLERGANLETKDKNGYTPLYLAIEGGSKEVVSLLLERGANLVARDKNGNTPLHHAAQGGRKEVIYQLRKKEANLVVKDEYEPLYYAADGVTSMEVVLVLLDRGAKMEAVNDSGRTALHLAAEGGCKEVLSLLLVKGAYLEAKDKDGKTALDLTRADDISLLLETAELSRRSKAQGADRDVKRAKIMLVGNGAAGKTTLVRRLRDNTFSPSEVITDGIEMSSVVIDDIELLALDCAGQREYVLMHRLFLGGLILAVYCPRNEDLPKFEANLQMITDAAPGAPILLVTTRADEARLDGYDERRLRSLFPSILPTVYAIDSSTGTGIVSLRSAIANTALTHLRDTVRKLPVPLVKLLTKIESMKSESSRFSLTASEFDIMGKDELGLDPDAVDLGKRLFNYWGIIFVLAEGSVVLRPQQLADVLSCVFTKIPEKQQRIGAVLRDGFLRHRNDAFEAIWGDYDKYMWSMDPNSPNPNYVPPFVQLLHDVFLAVRIYGIDGKPLDASLVPGLFPKEPLTSSAGGDVDVMEMSSKLFPAHLLDESMQHPIFTVEFKSPIPDRFMAIFLARAHSYCVLGSCWATGALLVNRNKAKEFSSVDSSAIVYVPTTTSANKLIILCAGLTTAVRSIALQVIADTIADTFPSLKNITDIIVTKKPTNKSRSWHIDDINDVLDDSSRRDIICHGEGCQIDISSLRIILRGSVKQELQTTGECDTPRHPNKRRRIVESFSEEADIFSSDSDILPGPLEALDEQLKISFSRLSLSPEVFESDLVHMDALLLKSIDAYLETMNLPVGSDRRRRLRVLWLPVIILNSCGDKEAKLVPCSPGPTPQDTWFCFLECSVTVDVEELCPLAGASPSTPQDRQSKFLRERVSNVVVDVLKMLGTSVPGAVFSPLPAAIPEQYVTEMLKVEAAAFIEIPTTVPKRFLHMMFCEKAQKLVQKPPNIESLRMVELKVFLAEELNRNNEAIGSKIISYVQVGLSSVNEKLCGQNEMLRTLIEDQHSCPTIPLIIPKDVKGLCGLFQKQFILFFVCPVTKKVVRSGPEGTGYTIPVSREWLMKAAHIMKLGLFVAKAAAAVYDIPFPLPGGVLVGGGTASMIDELQQNAVDKSIEYLDSQLESLGDKSLEAQALLTDVKDALKVIDDKNLSAGGTLNDRQKRQLKDCVSNGTRVAYQQIMKLLAKLEVSDSSISGWEPRYTGLMKCTSAKDGTTAWVSEEGRGVFMELGAAALE